LFCLELKTTERSITYWSKEFENKDKKQSFQIKKNQIEGLHYAGQFEGIIAGFVLNFRNVNRTYFLSIEKYDYMINNLNKKSFNHDDIVQIGAILIDQKLKRVRYTYDIDKFVSDMLD
jgi:recombination protein U